MLTTDELIKLAEEAEEIDLDLDSLPMYKNYVTKNPTWLHPPANNFNPEEALDFTI